MAVNAASWYVPREDIWLGRCQCRQLLTDPTFFFILMDEVMGMKLNMEGNGGKNMDREEELVKVLYRKGV